MLYNNVGTLMGLTRLLPQRAFIVIRHAVIAADIAHHRLAVMRALASGLAVTIHTAFFHRSTLDLVAGVVSCNTTTAWVTALLFGLLAEKPCGKTSVMSI